MANITISFTVDSHQASLLLTTHELITTAYKDYDDLSLQTLGNYTTLLSLLFDRGTRARVLEAAGISNEDLEAEISQFLSSYFREP